ncbi:Undecaprenyl pyrophosphate synthetase [Dissulfuribacter thermophilus]|uniref:Isoprenyl transferase n=2 Tax=Dissulfuribacter thermophilus TaxID=1156395 RepID=A0A1B9F7Z6_9BACT|nr:Undecaprenyl pyrophosphate synthetase [Dissulfuribacter thermophilus]
MDGNGRWAQKRGLPRIMGHRQGVKTVKRIVTLVREIGIKYLTLYAFSKENWQRPKEEVSTLMDLLYSYLEKELYEMLENDIRLETIGEIDLLPKRVKSKLFEVMKRTENNQSMVLCLALSYGGRNEIIRAAKKIAEDCIDGRISPDALNEELFSSYLYTSNMPDPDLIIRTSGEVRLSNFLLYQGAYSELYFTKTLWPDFDKEELFKALRDYASRERRFGKTSEQVLSR